jgi:NAD-dependent SIR2 family protein deacetylase
MFFDSSARNSHMAASACVRCGGNFFEVVGPVKVRDATNRLCFVQCADCGTVVTAVDIFNIGEMLKQQNTALEAIADKLGLQIRLER